MAFNETFSGPADEEISRSLRSLSFVPVTITTWDTGTLLHANKAAAALIGLPAEELEGRSILEFYVDPELRAALLRAIDAGGGTAKGEVQVRRADGRDIWLKVAAQRVLYRGQPSVLEISHDITEYVGSRRERAAVAASRAKSTFLAQMSHELRSPLNAILGFSEVIRGLHFGRDQVDKYAEYGGYIHQAGTHLLALMDDILDLAKVEAGKLELHRARFDLVELLDESARMMRPMVDGRGLKLHVVHGGAANLMLTADRRRAKQMIVNLLSNAIKFTPPGGKVELSAQLMSDQAIAVTISDTGIGMTEEEIAVALEPFGRISNPAADDPTGSGLGLPIVKNLIEAHGGRLQIRSELNRGTIMRLVFPPPA
jgi:PAS domain S-box-containing protein